MQEVTEITELSPRLSFCGTREVRYSLTNCKDFEDARETQIRGVSEFAPTDAKFFMAERFYPERSAGEGWKGPLYFKGNVNYYK